MLTLEHKQNISNALKGKKKSIEHAQKVADSNHGLKRSEESRIKMSIAQRKRILEGRHNNYFIDRSKVKERLPYPSMRNKWTNQVYKRDNFKCKINNNNCKGRIEAHHILRWSEYPELRFDLNNGITLCHSHHPFKKKDEDKFSPYFKKLINQSSVITQPI